MLSQNISFCIVFFATLALIDCGVHPLTCQSPETSLPSDAPPEKSYKLVYEWKDEDHTYNFLLRYRDPAEIYGNSAIARCLHVKLTFHTYHAFRVKVLDGNSKRWEIPDESPFPHFRHTGLILQEDSCCTVDIQSDPFSMLIKNKETGEVLFDTRDGDLVYTDRFIKLTTKIPSEHVYGFGERAYKFKLEPGVYTIWGRDEPDVIEDGRGGGNIYGHQPVGLFRGEKGNFFTTIMRNSNPKDVIIDKDKFITYKMTGGIIDLVFFVGDEYPDTSIKRYHEFSGKFVMMPFWSLGYHQSRWGYKNIDMFEEVVSRFRKENIPLDVMWSDVDYMILKETFTIDKDNFPPERLKALMKNSNIKWVPIVDCGIKVGGINNQKVVSRAYDEGVKRNIFLRNSKNEFMLAKVWPGAVFFPDFFNPDSEAYWKEMLEDFYQIVPFSGLWIDMNEVTNFVDGECQVRGNELVSVIGRVSPFNDLPYIPGGRPLETKTSSLDAVHYGNLLEHDVHELFSITQSKVTYDYMRSKTKLPFILTRSNFAGNGQYTAKWTGDNAARWEFLQNSIPGVFNYQIFGMPFTGADMCGFMRTTNPELCIRWYQTGAFYPFCRNHNNDMALPQEPWAFLGQHLGGELLTTAQASLKLRYAILKWYYSLFIATRGTGSVFRPLFFEFPHEDELYKSNGPTETQFLLGSGLMVTPNVNMKNNPVNAYFPKDDWFNFLTGEKTIEKENENRYASMTVPYDGHAPVFIRAGHIVHVQNVATVSNTEELNDEFELIIAFARNPVNKKLEARGSIIGVQKFDDDTIHDKCVLENCLYNITAQVTTERKNDAVISINIESADKSRGGFLDNLGIYSLKVYGLPLEFMEEDEDKFGNTMGLLYDKDGEISQILLTKEATSTIRDAFHIPFLNFARVKDGDNLVIKIVL